MYSLVSILLHFGLTLKYILVIKTTRKIKPICLHVGLTLKNIIVIKTTRKIKPVIKTSWK